MAHLLGSLTDLCLFACLCSYFLSEIPDFLSPEEADHIIDVAEDVGFLKSSIHLDPVAKKHAATLRSMEGKYRAVTIKS